MLTTIIAAIVLPAALGYALGWVHARLTEQDRLQRAEDAAFEAGFARAVETAQEAGHAVRVTMSRQRRAVVGGLN